jgi:hypothetical protein
VQLRIWPFNRFATLGIPDAFKAIPDAQS